MEMMATAIMGSGSSAEKRGAAPSSRALSAMARSALLRCGGAPFLIFSSSVATVRALSSSGVSSPSARRPASPVSAAKNCASSGFKKGRPGAEEGGAASMASVPSGPRGTP